MTQCDSQDGIVLQVGVIHEEGRDGMTNKDTERWENLEILDSCCNTSIEGAEWVKDYTRRQKGGGRQEIGDIQKSENTFIFGDGARVKSKGTTVIPITTHKGEATIRLDVVENDIPLIISKTEMRNLEVVGRWLAGAIEIKDKSAQALLELGLRMSLAIQSLVIRLS